MTTLLKSSKKAFRPFAVTFGILGALLFGLSATTAYAADMTVYKSPSCGCCGDWIKHVEDAGLSVDVKDVDDMTQVKALLGVPTDMESCHTAIIDGYLIEGHVPADDIMRLLMERPEARGLAVPGMPIGSPGMEMGDEKDPYDVYLFGKNGTAEIFSRH